MCLHKELVKHGLRQPAFHHSPSSIRSANIEKKLEENDQAIVKVEQVIKQAAIKKRGGGRWCVQQVTGSSN